MVTIAKIIGIFCGLWIFIDVIGALWFIWLHHKGKLVQDVPESLKDIF